MRLFWKLRPQRGVNSHKEMKRTVKQTRAVTSGPKRDSEQKALPRQPEGHSRDRLMDDASSISALTCLWESQLAVCCRAWLWRTEADLLPEQLADSRKINAREDMSRPVRGAKGWQRACQRPTHVCHWAHAVSVPCSGTPQLGLRGWERKEGTQAPQTSSLQELQRQKGYFFF